MFTFVKLCQILVNCTNVFNGKIGYCACNTCFEFNGDCDSDNQCQTGLVCGSKNCPVSLGFDWNTDCCYDAIIGDKDFCSLDNPCESGEGHCDSNDECQNGLFCGSENCKDTSSMDCCESQGNTLFTTGIPRLTRFLWQAENRVT